MGDWSKLYDAITKPLPIVSALFLILFTSILLFGSPRLANSLGLGILVGPYRFILGTLFLIGICWLIITTLLPLGKWIHKKWLHRLQVKKLEGRLGRLTADEKLVLGNYLKLDIRACSWTGDDLGAAQGLADDGILYKPQVPQHAWGGTSYNITDETLAYLRKCPQLVDVQG